MDFHRLDVGAETPERQCQFAAALARAEQHHRLAACHRFSHRFSACQTDAENRNTSASLQAILVVSA
jgi:hypothetical protein